jgi:hypothetical protein
MLYYYDTRLAQIHVIVHYIYTPFFLAWSTLPSLKVAHKQHSNLYRNRSIPIIRHFVLYIAFAMHLTIHYLLIYSVKTMHSEKPKLTII